MTRTQISLTEDQHQYLTTLSRRSGLSISALIRDAIERLRSEQEIPTKKAYRLLGAFHADRHDVSVNHDNILWNDPGDHSKDPS